MDEAKERQRAALFLAIDEDEVTPEHIARYRTTFAAAAAELEDAFAALWRALVQAFGPPLVALNERLKRR